MIEKNACLHALLYTIVCLYLASKEIKEYDPPHHILELKDFCWHPDASSSALIPAHARPTTAVTTYIFSLSSGAVQPVWLRLWRYQLGIDFSFSLKTLY